MFKNQISTKLLNGIDEQFVIFDVKHDAFRLTLHFIAFGIGSVLFLYDNKSWLNWNMHFSIFWQRRLGTYFLKCQHFSQTKTAGYYCLLFCSA